MRIRIRYAASYKEEQKFWFASVCVCSHVHPCACMSSDQVPLLGVLACACCRPRAAYLLGRQTPALTGTFAVRPRDAEAPARLGTALGLPPKESCPAGMSRRTECSNPLMGAHTWCGATSPLPAALQANATLAATVPAVLLGAAPSADTAQAVGTAWTWSCLALATWRRVQARR